LLSMLGTRDATHFLSKDDKVKFEMQATITDFATRKEKNGFKKDLLHNVRDNYGSLSNIDAAPNINNLTDFAKIPGRRVHKKRSVCFASQLKVIRK